MPTDNITNPHDKFFRETFSRREVARDFVKYYLPAEVVELLDLDSLEISKDSFVDPTLEEHFSDLLYQVQANYGQQLYIYFLFDHKSYVDSLVSFQLLRYMVRIWELDLKQQREQRKSQPRSQKTPFRLPCIFPLVVYHGLDKWTVNTELWGMFDLPEVLRAYVPNYHYWLVDLSQVNDHDIKGYVFLQVGLLLLKYIQRDELEERLPDILGLLKALVHKQSALEYLETILRYIMNSSDKVTKAVLQEKVHQLFEQGGTSIMPTIAETLREEGRQQVQAVAEEKIREAQTAAEGKIKQAQTAAEGKIKQVMIRNIRQTLAIRFSIPLEQFDTVLTHLEVAALEELNELAFMVATLADFEAKLLISKP